MDGCVNPPDMCVFTESKKLTNSFNDVGQDNSIGDIIRQILYASLGFDLFQVMVGPVSVDLFV